MAVAGEAVVCGATQAPPDCAEQPVAINMTLATNTAQHIRLRFTNWCMFLDIAFAPEPAPADIKLLPRKPVHATWSQPLAVAKLAAEKDCGELFSLERERRGPIAPE